MQQQGRVPASELSVGGAADLNPHARHECAGSAGAGKSDGECAVAVPRDLWAHLSVVRSQRERDAGTAAAVADLDAAPANFKGGGGPDELGLPASKESRPRMRSSMPRPDRIDPRIPVDGDRSVSSARWDHGQPYCVGRVRPECHSGARPSIPAHARFRGTLASQPGHPCETTEVPNRAFCNGTPSPLRKYRHFLRPST